MVLKSITSSRSRSSTIEGFEDECSNFESNALEMLNKLLEKELIELLESKHSEEVQRTNDPKYCKYYRIISNPIKNARHLGDKPYNLQTKEKLY